MDHMKSAILNAVAKAQKEPTDIVSIYKNDQADASAFKNEMLFFIKPEITLPSSTIKLDQVLDIVNDKLKEFNMTVASVDVLGAKYLKEKNIMASHYGVINKIASNAKGAMSQTAKENFEKSYGLKVEDANVLGGYEFLAKYPFFNETSLEVLCQNITPTKLAGGTYCCVTKVNGDMVYLINGFHPMQLQHFIKDGRSIVTFHVLTNTDWSVARGDFIGATNPAKATKGSIRSIFLEKKDALGLEDVSQGSNGVHLSAGPIEALVELCRFSNKPITDESVLKQHIAGKDLLGSYSNSKIQDIANDAKVTFEDKQTSIFEVTEDKNTKDAVELIRTLVSA
ncbi:MAG TPA: hypothetical protein VGF14_05675 [Alphaproteobacteria bacterium]